MLLIGTGALGTVRHPEWRWEIRCNRTRQSNSTTSNTNGVQHFSGSRYDLTVGAWRLFKSIRYVGRWNFNLGFSFRSKPERTRMQIQINQSNRLEKQYNLNIYKFRGAIWAVTVTMFRIDRLSTNFRSSQLFYRVFSADFFFLFI